MINSIVGLGSVTVSAGTSGRPYYNMNNQNPAMGSLRFNAYTSTIEAFDGITWVQMPSTVPSISLDPEAEAALSWARKQMQNEVYILGLSKEYPAIKELLDQLTDIKHKIDMVVALVKPNEKV